MNRRERIKMLKESRGESSRYLLNFISNFARASVLMHKCLKAFSGDMALIEEAKRSYIILMVSSLETFYRDIAIHILNMDNQTLEQAMEVVNVKKKLHDIYRMLQEEISFQEYVVSHFNFQNIDTVNEYMSLLLKPEKYIEKLGNTETKFFVLGKVNGPRKINLNGVHKEWKKKFALLFKKRHNFVHNSNAPCKLTNKELSDLEALTLTIAHVTAYMVSTKYKSDILMTDGLPALLTPDDIISEDWELKNKDKD